MDFVFHTYLQDDVREEWEKYGDLIVDDLRESYLNLTVKTLRMLKWVLHNCSQAKYLIKMDDDVFLHMPKLLTFLLSQPGGYNPKLIAGHRYNGVKVDRDPWSKWFTPKSAYRAEKFPPFVAGFCYVLGMQAAQELYDAGMQLSLFHLEDVFLTGIVASKQHYELQQPGKIVTIKLWYHNFKTIKWIQEYIIVHEVSPTQFRCWTKRTLQTDFGLTSDLWPAFISCLV